MYKENKFFKKTNLNFMILYYTNKILKRREGWIWDQRSHGGRSQEEWWEVSASGEEGHCQEVWRSSGPRC